MVFQREVLEQDRVNLKGSFKVSFNFVWILVNNCANKL